jgi:hypothetical protein
MAGSCEGGNELSVSIIGGKFLDKLGSYWVLRKNSSSWR